MMHRGLTHQRHNRECLHDGGFFVVLFFFSLLNSESRAVHILGVKETFEFKNGTD